MNYCPADNSAHCLQGLIIYVYAENHTKTVDFTLLVKFRHFYVVHIDNILCNRLIWAYKFKYVFILLPIIIMVKVKVGYRSSTVVKVLCYKSEGRWFDPSWCHWNFSLS